MKPFAPDDYSHYRTTPVAHQTWNPQTKVVAVNLLAQLRNQLAGLEPELLHMGSTALEIAGKNDIELYVYPPPALWDETAQRLTGVYGEPGHREVEFIRFDAQVAGFEIEIIQLRGYMGRINKAVYKYLSENPALCTQYVSVKKNYSFSKREYQKHKDLFFAEIVRQIPEDYVP